MADTCHIGLQAKYRVALFPGGGRHIPQRLGAAQMDEEELARRKPIQGKARADVSHGAGFAGDIEFEIRLYMSSHSNFLVRKQTTVAGIVDH